jgi:hypothetical protein
MSTFEVGQRIRIRGNVLASSAPATYAADPTYTATDATVVLTVEDPSGVETTPAVTNAAADGYYYAEVDLDEPGLWRFEWAATGAVIAAKDGTFTVERPLT